MAKAMGLNTVCAYLFWNLHERAPGEYDWTGQADVAEFCRIAQEEGLWVILRPGPYACAEWEMGGMPWWLLKDEDIKLRSRDPRFVEAATRYLKEVGKNLAPLQISRGGPILMVQVENEYGFYGKDSEYMGLMRKGLIDAGFEVPLFACNPTAHLRDGYREDLFPVVNFGSDPAGAFRALREILPRGPLMCGEFYPGWFDTWGAPHHRGKAQMYLDDLETMLKMNASFSIYMAHGGTTFGFWAGADRPFKPDTSSYDYDAPISEAGWETEKFFLTRSLISKYLPPGEELPAVPARNPVTTFPEIILEECASLWEHLPSPVRVERPRSMEMYNQGFGCILYRTELPSGPAARIEAGAIHDFGYIFIDGERSAITDRRNGNYSFAVPAREQAVTLDILVEPMGRVNFGVEAHDRKGLRAPVRFVTEGGSASEILGWSIFTLPLDTDYLRKLTFSPAKRAYPAFWRGKFNIEKVGDVFLDLRTCGKGVIWVNGHCLARYWNIGPTQSAYLPAPWINQGENEIIVLDYLDSGRPRISGMDTPILDLLRPELDLSQKRRAVVTVQLTDKVRAAAGAFRNSPEAQVVRFAPLQGRYFALQSLSAFGGGPAASIAELSLLDPDGRTLSSEGWRVAYVDSEETIGDDGAAENAIDGQIANCWRTRVTGEAPGHPHLLVLDLGKPGAIGGFSYVARQGRPDIDGRIRDYRVYVGDQLIDAGH